MPIEQLSVYHSSALCAQTNGASHVLLTTQILSEKDERLFLRIPQMKHFVSLGRYDPQGRFDAFDKHGDKMHYEPHWIAPSFGNTESDVLHDTQFLLWEREDGRYGILLPLVDGHIRVSLSGTKEKGVCLVADGALSGNISSGTRLACTALGDDPFVLIQETMRDVRDALQTFELRENKQTPPYAKYLGWCTWDAFYTELDEQGVLDGLKSFQEGGIQPKFMILDDGWLDVENTQLKDFPACNKSFPHGLRSLIEKTKTEYGIELFAVWHAFVGYWWGLHADGALAQRYRLLKNSAYTPFGGWREKDPLNLIHPDDIQAFYEEFHAWLHAQGVDMVKVDGQSGLEWFTAALLDHAPTMATYQDALQTASHKYFKGNVLHCMSQSNDVAYNLKTSNAWRNSMDYYPKAPRAVQQAHVHQNAMNNIWSQQFCQPDWDMFQTHADHAEFHAMARAISGGPIYVSDHPNKQDFDLLARLCTKDGKALLCDAPALPARDSLFTDCWNEPSVLKIDNKCGTAAVIGLFHCSRQTDDVLRAHYSPADVSGQAEEYLCWQYGTKTLVRCHAQETFSVELEPATAALIWVQTLDRPIISFGLTDKYNAPASVQVIEQTQTSLCGEALDSGTYLAWTSSSPCSVTVNGQPTDFSYDQKSGTLIVHLVQKGTVTIELL